MSTTATIFEQNRRRFLRIQFDGITQLDTGTGWRTVTLQDLSLKGALISSPAPLDWQAGDCANLKIQLATDGTTLNFQTRLVRTMGNQSGIRFEIIDLDTMTHLRRLMELNLGDENLLERELEHLFPTD